MTNSALKAGLIYTRRPKSYEIVKFFIHPKPNISGQGKINATFNQKKKRPTRLYSAER